METFLGYVACFALAGCGVFAWMWRQEIADRKDADVASKTELDRYAQLYRDAMKRADESQAHLEDVLGRLKEKALTAPAQPRKNQRVGYADIRKLNAQANQREEELQEARERDTAFQE